VLLAGTGNNLESSDELSDRDYWILRVSDTAHPAEQTGLKHPNLEEWMRENRGELIWAINALVPRWVNKGRPGLPESIRPLAGSRDGVRFLEE
jgi:hypothetical protein